VLSGSVGKSSNGPRAVKLTLNLDNVHSLALELQREPSVIYTVACSM
jgi:hypothetical protein